MTVGEKIRLKRKEKGWTQKKLGELSGISEFVIRHYELGYRVPKIITLKKIALPLDISVNYFLDLDHYEEAIFEKLIGIKYSLIVECAEHFNLPVYEFMEMVMHKGIRHLEIERLDNEMIKIF